MSETDAKPTPKPTPAPKGVKGGKKLAKVGVLGALILAIAFLLNHFGVTDFGTGSGEKDGESESPAVNVKTTSEPPAKLAGDGGKTGTGELPLASVTLKVLPTRVELSVLVKDQTVPVVDTFESLEDAMAEMAALFERVQTQLISVSVDLNYKPRTNEEIRKMVEAALADVKGAAKTQVKVSKIE